MGTYSFTGAAQFVTVTDAGTYDITAYGAQGGSGFTATGGNGAEVGGTFSLQAGEKLEIIAGGAGAYNRGGGGGGASIVLADVNSQGALTPGTYAQVLLVAAGGGGAATGRNGGNGSAATGAAGGAGGTAGAGGGSGGGAGLKNNGGTAGNSAGEFGTYNGGGGGRDVANGSAGGAGGSQGGRGGFGGGGGGGFYGGGGGGGYTGGNGHGGTAGQYASGGGGTSYDAGIAVAAKTISGQNAGNGKVLIVCYCTGTLIRTVRGDVAVEHLAVGDLVVTASGEQRPIRWLGHQTQRLAGPAQPRSAWPVRVAAGAFGDNKPDRDLFLSPGHSVCVGMFDEVLVPVQELVNGSTVAYVTDWTEVTYWHVELDSHDILIANNMPAESFLEMGENRRFFDGVGTPDAAPDVLARSHADFCRRFVDGGPLLATMREELRLRAERLGWQPERTVALACHAGESVVQPYINGGEALFAIPTGVGELRVSTGLSVPALLGEADDRSLGLALYSIALLTAAGEERGLDLDDASVRDCFHPGERREGLHYRWNRGDLVLPASFTAGLSGPLMLRLRFEASTVRGWSEPAHRAQKPTLRAVA